MNLLRGSTLATVILLSSGCMQIETGRQVMVDLDLREIAIVKRERMLAVLTVEGPFPKSNETAFVISHLALTGHGRTQLIIPDNAHARYGALVSGQIDLDFDRMRAVVKVRPAEKYSWLHLDGEYPIVFGKLWKGAPKQPSRVTAPSRPPRSE